MAYYEDGVIVSRVLKPVMPTPGARYQQRQDEMCEQIRRQGLPLPREYAEWYVTREVDAVKRELVPEIRYCATCQKPLEDKAENSWIPSFNELTSKRPLRRYCTRSCAARGKQSDWRRRHPEKHKINR